jgi:hypothetical protein
VRFRPGHNMRGMPQKPWRYPNTHHEDQTVPIHRLRAQQALGRPLPAGVIVHHADGSRDPWAPLVICESQAYHGLLHRRMRVKAAGGDPNTQRICCSCKLLLLKTAFSAKASQFDGLRKTCRRCECAAAKRRSMRRKAAAQEAIGEIAWLQE